MKLLTQLTLVGSLALGLLTGDPNLFAAEPPLPPLPNLDRDGDSLSDIWQTFYQTGPLNPEDDDDKDGLSNRMEEKLGTDPRDPRSGLSIESINIETETHSRGTEQFVRVTFFTQPGMDYSLLASSKLGGTSRWEPIGSIEGTDVSLADLRVPLEDSRDALRFFQITAANRNEDEDLLSAWEEAIIGTSDQTQATSSPNADLDFASQWMLENELGFASGNLDSKLYEVDVICIGGVLNTGSRPRVVTSHGSGRGGWTRLTSWQLQDDTAQPQEQAELPPLQGHLGRLIRLGDSSFPNQGYDRFVSGLVRANGLLYLSSRSLDFNGQFIHHRTVGVNPRLPGEEDYDLVDWAGDYVEIVDRFQLVTAVHLTSDSGDPIIRLVSWELNGNTGFLNGADQLDIPELYDLPETATGIQVTYQSAGIWSLSFERFDGSWHTHYFRLSNTGILSSIEGGWPRNTRLTGSIHITEPKHATIRQGTGRVNAFLTNDASPEVILRVTEPRWTDFQLLTGKFRPSLVATSENDLTPLMAGVKLAPPRLNDSRLDQRDQGDRLGASLALGDYDGDGHLDLAAGAPGQDGSNGTINAAGKVQLFYGGKDGLSDYYRHERWHQSVSGITDFQEANDFFGSSVAAGDFNNDGYDELAIGVPGETLFDVSDDVVSRGGQVHILQGSSAGLTTNGSQMIREFSAENLNAKAEEQDEFGTTLATGDFNGDSFEDLAIGTPLNDEGATNSGAVDVYWGSAQGLITNHATRLVQGAGLLDGSREEGDRFGSALAVADFNQDGRDDLAIGVPLEDVGELTNAGAVHIFFGANNKSFGSVHTLTQDDLRSNDNVLDPTEAFDTFGTALTTGRFNDDPYPDLAISAQSEDVTQNGVDYKAAGMVHVVSGSANGFNTKKCQTTTASLGNPYRLYHGSLADNLFYGAALAASDLDGNGYDELIVGATGFSNDTDTAAGLIHIVQAIDTGLSWDDRIIDRDTPGIFGSTTSFENFGEVLLAARLNSDDFGDLLVGIPDEFGDDDNETNAGSVLYIPGTDVGFETFLDTEANRTYTDGEFQGVRAIATDMITEEALGTGEGALFKRQPSEEKPWVHIASVTKNTTLLLAVEAIIDGVISLNEPIDISNVAGTTGGSMLDDPALNPTDTVPLNTLMYGMMMNSGNRASVAIGEAIAAARGFPECSFVTLMNNRAKEIGLTHSLYGHPAGGCITTLQDQVTLWREAAKHGLFLGFAGTRFYDSSAFNACGMTTDGDPLCWDLTKFATFGSSGYPGLRAYKGGNGRLWWDTDPYGSNEDSCLPFERDTDIPNCTASGIGQITRLDRTVVTFMQQTGDRAGDLGRLTDYAFEKIFTPDLQGRTRYPGDGNPNAIVDGPSLIATRTSSAIVGSRLAVTASIHNGESLSLDAYRLSYRDHDITHASGTFKNDNLAPGLEVEATHPLSINGMPVALSDQVGDRLSISDLLTVNLDGNDVALRLWRLGEDLRRE